MFIVEFLTRGSTPTPRYPFTNTVAAGEANTHHREEREQLQNKSHTAPLSVPAPIVDLGKGCSQETDSRD